MRRAMMVMGWMALAAWAGMAGAAEEAAALPPEVRARLRIPAPVDPVFMEVAPVRAGQGVERFEAAHPGGDRLLFRLRYREPVTADNASFTLYLDLDDDPDTGRRDAAHRGVDLMIRLGEGGAFSISGIDVRGIVGIRHDNRHPALYPHRENAFSVAAVDGHDLYLTLQTPLLGGTEDRVRFRAYLAGITASAQADLPRAGAPLPDIGPMARRYRQEIRFDHHMERHPAGAGYLALESFDFKGLDYWDVAPLFPVDYGRPMPRIAFSTAARRPGGEGRPGRHRVPVQLLEEAGVARPEARLLFGFPFPAGELFQPDRIRLVGADGEGIEAQFTVVSYWPDDSLKWVQVEAGVALEAGGERALYLEYGDGVEPQVIAEPLRLEENDGLLVIDTGPLAVEIDRQRFNLFRRVWRNEGGRRVPVAASAESGIELTDADGRVYRSSAVAPERFEIEKAGPLSAVVRVEGALADGDGNAFMRYIVRLTFRAGSARIDVAHTLLNDRLATEFTDFASLVLPLEIDGADSAGGRMYRRPDGEGAVSAAIPAGRVFQHDDRRHSVDGADPVDGRLPGLFSALADGANPVSVAVRAFWERWPKGLSLDGGRLAIELLPRLPGPDFAGDLPWYLQIPFVDGFYRLKWGMSSTEHLVLDFGGTAPGAVLAEARLPVVPVIPGGWYAQTGALGRMAAPLGRQFAAYDAYVEESFRAHLGLKEEQREYGFLNYGDWFGERFNRNWGNNEYDLAHGFFMQFARTGNRDFFRFALEAARHQADVDIVHAYPDPFYVGANLQHGIGHAGVTYYHLKHKTWSWAYTQAVWGGNGHAWSHGMVAAWFLAGEPRVKEAALSLGEHLVWSVPRLQRLTALGRTVGRPMRALHALYGSTYDPAYLEAAREIFRTVQREPDPRRRLQGAIREGLMFLNDMAEDPEVVELYMEGARGDLTRWDPGIEGFGETMASWPRPMTAYAGLLSGEAEFMEIAERILFNSVRGSNAIGKEIAMIMYMASDTLALLQDWYAAHRPDRGAEVLSTRDYGLLASLLRAPEAERHLARFPRTRRFLARAADTGGRLTLRGDPHGPQLGDRTAAGRVIWRTAGGHVLGEQALDAYGEQVITQDLEAGAGPVLVEIEDDGRTVWSAEGEGVQVMVEASRGFVIGNRARRNRYYVRVPEGTEAFEVRVRGAHDGYFGAAVLTPDRRLAGHVIGANTRGFSIEGDEWKTLSIRPDRLDTGHTWELVLWASGNTAVEIAGIPPYLFLRPEDGFPPEGGD